jgi:serine/threonine-protein kinase
MAKQPSDRFASAGDLARAAGAAASAVQVPTAVNPAPLTMPPPQTQPARRGFGPGQWVLAGTTFGVFVGLVGLVLWLVLGQNRTQDLPTPATTSMATQTSEPLSTTTAPPPLAMPGTDAQGFVDYPGARCDAGNSPAALARTPNSVLVVCRSGPGEFYYRGVRLSDGAGIELANAVRSSGGFDVTNPTDGTRYQIRPDALTIIPPDGRAITEPMVAYAAR